MKCLLYKEQFDQKEQLKHYYVTFHNVDSSNHFLQNFFKLSKSKFVSKKCLRCDYFLPATRFKTINNFLKYYEDGKLKPFEDKPIEK